MTVDSVLDVPADIAAAAEAVDREIPGYIDYFAPGQPVWFTLPDGVQRIQVAVLSEGQRRRYLNETNREVRMNAKTRDMVMKSAVGDDLHALIKTAVTDWDVKRAGNPVAFSTQQLEQALDVWPPAIVDFIADKVREVNPWLNGTEDDLPALEDEYRQLGERIAELKDRQAKN